MLNVLSPDEALALIKKEFFPCVCSETAELHRARGRILAEDIIGSEFVPGFNRSTVDGYALRAADSFGCSEALPAILELSGRVDMGESARVGKPGDCVYVPTGAAVPDWADGVAMIEHCEAYGDGTIGIMRPVAPGENMIYRGDDLFPGKCVLKAGRRLGAQDIGALAAMGLGSVPVVKRPVLGIISTGDELVEISDIPGEGQVRDVNSAMLAALMEEAGAEVLCFGIVRDDFDSLLSTVESAMGKCDMLLISGGSSVGLKDATARVISRLGEVLFHGIAMKPGKPTILGRVRGKPLWGLPGHPVAAFFVGHIFVRAMLARLMGREIFCHSVSAMLTENLSANHGRAQYSGVHLIRKDGEYLATPIRAKSGLISSLAGSQGYICIPRDREGAAAGETVEVHIYSIEQEAE